MRVAIALAQPLPGTKGASGLAYALCAAIQQAGHEAELVPIPFAADTAGIAGQMLACRMLDLSESAGTRIDRLIALDFPAYLLPHDNKVLWLTGQHADAYERWGQAGCRFFGEPGGVAARDAVRAADRRTMAEARRVWTLSRHAADRIRRFHGVDAAVLYPPPAPQRRPRNAPQDQYFFVPESRASVVLGALALTRRPVRLVFEGAASPSPPAPSPAIWLDGITDTQRADLLAGCIAVVAVPSSTDDPAPALAALAAGRPVITTDDSGATAELLRHGVTGLICEPDPAALAEAMDALWSNRLRVRLMGELAAEAAAALGLNWETIAQCLLD